MTGEGSHVETSQLGALVGLQALPFMNIALTGEEYRRFRREEEPNPLYNVYRAKADQWLMLTGIDAKRDWPNVCHAVGRPELAEDARATSFEQLRAHSRELTALLDEAIATRDRTSLIAELRRHKVVCAPVQHPREAFLDDQARANGYLQPVRGEDFDMAAWPLKLGGEPVRIARRAPTCGEDTDAVLEELGYSPGDIRRLRASKAVR